jgi:hypothetical protein
VERQNRIVTILSLLLLALVAVAVLGKEPKQTAEEAAEGPSSDPAFPDLKSVDIQKIALSGPSGEIALERADGAWKMTAPKTVPVDDRSVQEVADRFATVELTERPLTQTASAYGLDAAQRIEVTLTTTAGATHRLFVGLDAPVGYAAYVSREADGKPLVASSQLRDLAARTPDDFRSRSLVALSPGTATRIRIADGAQVVTLRKDGSGWWLGDDGPRARAEAVETWLSDASAARVAAFLDDQDPGALGLMDPQASFTVDDANGSVTVRFAGRSSTEAVAIGAGAPVRVEADALALVRLDGWLDDKLVPVRQSQLQSVEVSLGGKSFAAKQTDGVWKRPDGNVVDPSAFFDALSAVPADRSATGLPAPAEPPDAQIVLIQADGARSGVAFGPPGPGGRRVAREIAGGPPFHVEQSALEALTAAVP